MDLGLKDKVALITSASRGLGRAAVEALAEDGAKVVVVARPSKDLKDIESRFTGRCAIVAGDMLDPQLPSRAVETAMDKFGRLDITVVNTPGPKPILPLQAADSDFETAYETTFYPAVRLIRASVSAMQPQRHGRIVIVSSTSVKAPKPFLCLSAAARSALWAWAKSAAPELYADGITINAIFAGPHETDRALQLGVKDRRMGRPDHFGQFVASLCGHTTSFITGTGFLVDGGELTGI